MDALHQAQDQELIEIALSYPTEKISREVRDMVFFSLSKEEEESIQFIHSLSLKFKGDGATSIENRLIHIDTEFWLKNFFLEITKAENKIDEETFQKQSLVLQLEKIKHMQEACQGDLAHMEIKYRVDTASKVLPQVYASASTRKYLMALGKEKIVPKTLAEKKLQELMIKYFKEEQDLIGRFFP